MNDRVEEIAKVQAEIYAEVKRAVEKFPAFNSAHEGFSVLNEEVDELWDEVRRDDYEKQVKEAIQVGAMAVRFIMDIREKYIRGRTFSF